MSDERQVGWYADPGGAYEHRYWDGARWTDHVANGSVRSTAPLSGTSDRQEANAPQHELVPAIFKWLDDTFYGVRMSNEFVIVPLPPDTPFMVGAFRAPDAGSLFDVRAPFLHRVPLGPAVYEFAGRNDSVDAEGHVRVVPDRSDRGIGHLELRYCIGSTLMNQQSLAQLGLRMSKVADRVGRQAQQHFGGVLIKSKPG